MLIRERVEDRALELVAPAAWHAPGPHGYGVLTGGDYLGIEPLVLLVLEPILKLTKFLRPLS